MPEPLDTGTLGPIRIALPKTARERVRAVAKGGQINTTYRLPPGEAVEAFRKDLLLILAIAED